VPGGTLYNFGYGNQPVDVLSRWRKPGDNTAYQKFSQNFNLSNSSTDATNSNIGYGDASYIRLRNASASWKFPKKWLDKIGFQSGRVFINGQNLLTFTNYKGLDPETQSSTTLPSLRVVSIGLQFGL
jgi:hypothetical protein